MRKSYVYVLGFDVLCLYATNDSHMICACVSFLVQALMWLLL